MTTRTSVPRAKPKKQQPKQTEPVYIPFEGDLTSEDKLTGLRTRYFYLIAEAEAVSREIARLGGGDVWTRS